MSVPSTVPVPPPPSTPPPPVMWHADSYTGPPCPLCRSDLKRKGWIRRKVLGCINEDCKNYYRKKGEQMVSEWNERVYDAARELPMGNDVPVTSQQMRRALRRLKEPEPAATVPIGRIVPENEDESDTFTSPIGNSFDPTPTPPPHARAGGRVMGSTWTLQYCRSCNKINWIHLSDDDSDGCGIDAHGFECWKCHEQQPWPGWDEDMQKAVYFDDGVRCPPTDKP